MDPVWVEPFFVTRQFSSFAFSTVAWISCRLKGKSIELFKYLKKVL